MYLKIARKFDAAHHLYGYDGDCANVHGHTWKVLFIFQGRVNQATGMVIDFKDVKKMLDAIIDSTFDHKDLNKTLNLDRPTAEMITFELAKMVIHHLEESGLENQIWVDSIEVWESDDCSVMWQYMEGFRDRQE